MKAEIVAATAEHAEAIAMDAREADIAELWAQAKATPLEAMEYGLQFGARTGLLDGVPACMFGVSPHPSMPGTGVPWLVSSDRMQGMAAQKRLLVASRAQFDGMKARYALLFNVVDDRNKAAMRWLRWLGFDVGEPFPHGPFRMPFRIFQWSAK